MWKGTAPCRKNRLCPLAVERSEHLVYLIWDYHGGGDPLPCENARFMTVDTAKKILNTEAHTALESGKDTLLVQLMGGDPLKRFEEFRTMCEWAWSELPVSCVKFELTTTLDISREDAFLWYIDHREQLRLWLRCERLNSDIADFASKTGCGIAFGLGNSSKENMYGDICWILENRIPISFFFTETSETGIRSYDNLLQRMQEHPDALALPAVQDTMDLIEANIDLPRNYVQGKCYDTNGWVWTCPALSHLFLHSWSMDQTMLEQYLEEQTHQSLKWLCPGQILRAPNRCEQMRSFNVVKLCFGFHALSKLNDDSINSNIRKILLEAKESDDQEKRGI